MSSRKKKRKNKKGNKQQTKINKSQRLSSGIQRYHLKLTFAGPLITQASGVKALGLDATMLKNTENIPVIPGSLIRGNIRHALQYFQKLFDVGDANSINNNSDKNHDNKVYKTLKQSIPLWFGEQSSENNSENNVDESYTPIRAQVDFSFHWQLQNPKDFEKHQGQRTRIAIEKDETKSNQGTVKEGALQVIEDCFPLGCQKPVFSGEITHRYKTKNDKKLFKQWLNKALAYVPAMGSFKGIGFGRLVKAELTEIAPCKTSESKTSANQFDIPDTAEKIGLRLTLNDPFCLGKPVTPDSNFIVSKDYIAGSVIKGLIARLYQNDFQHYKQHQQQQQQQQWQQKLCFDDLIISHALPVPISNTDTSQALPSRPAPAALSLVFEKGEDGNKLIDLANDLSLEALANYQPDQAPVFQIDWKQSDWDNYEKEKSGTNHKKPKRLLALRTEINQQHNTSEEGKLFSLECIDPTGFHWCANINLSQIDIKQRKNVINHLKQILKNGLYGIGKTKASASVELLADAFDLNNLNTLNNNATQLDETDCFYCITLISEARLLPPDLQIAGTNSDADLYQAYQNYFSDLHPDIHLQPHFFARQTLSSGYYHLKMNQQKISNYYPEWLTDAGSVFIVKANSEAALQQLNQFAKTGLPAHREVDKQQANWQTSPYIHQNGYGECRITKQGVSND